MGPTRSEIERVAAVVVDATLRVHRELGPGLLESAYQVCFQHELESRALNVRTEVRLPISYADIVIDGGYRIDMLVEDVIIIENKAVTTLLPVHEAQLLTYLKLSDRRLGFLINWNVPLIRDGIRRLVLRL